MCKDEAKCLAKQAEAKLCQCMYGHGPGHVDVGQHETRDETERTHKKMARGDETGTPLVRFDSELGVDKVHVRRLNMKSFFQLKTDM